MKRVFVFLSVLFLTIISTFSAPFGLKMGMSLDEISKNCEEQPSFLKDEIYLIKPIKSHPVFQYYAVYVNSKIGLYQIRAVSDTITCNKYGTEIQNAFNNVKDRIAKTYGKPKIHDYVDPNIFLSYQKEEYWFCSLVEGSRELSASWGENESLSDDLDSVVLECMADSGYLDGTANLILYYYFNNAKFVEDEQDSVF